MPLHEKLAFYSEAIESGCIEWHGSKNENGYGLLWHDRALRKAHRLAWISAGGDIPEGMFINHLCGNPGCVNVSHLSVATVAENTQYQTRLRSDNSTGFRGVQPTGNGRWYVRIGKDGVYHSLGTFDTVEEADRVATDWRRENFAAGEFEDWKASIV